MKDGNKRWVSLALAMLWVAFIFSRSMQNGAQSTNESDFFLFRLIAILPWITERFVRKSAHFMEYFALGMLLYWTARMWKFRFSPPALSAALAGLMVALADETIQLYVPGRSGSPLDVWLDFAGVITGIVVVLAFAAIKNKRIKQ